ncbi:MAG: hypothetical protein AAFN27_24670, partial [Pseudomonadota bacterium]
MMTSPATDEPLMFSMLMKVLSVAPSAMPSPVSFATLNTFINIENINGSSVAGDVIIGDDIANVINGLGGDDTINGGDGNDTLLGNLGDDTV